ncbi:MAG: hypothetical protein PHO93_03400 [Candidatus Saccharimonadaceae bacterium]|mgnify:CR=1 FL=1|jgi:hypothetical protein|nr:hypothetical protein [Candidatus Saccharimonadaceae bacterium]
MKKNPKFLILLLMSICLILTFAACNKGNGADTDGEIDTTFVSGTLDGVKSIGNGNSEVPTDLVPDNSGKVTFNTPESKKPHDVTVTCELDNGILSSDLNAAIGGKTVTLSYASPTVSGGGYKIRPGSLCVNGEVITDFHFVSSDGSNDFYTTSFIMPEIAATVTASEYFYYNVAIAESIDNGSISLDKTDYEYSKNTTITVTVTPDSGYRLKEGGLRWDDTEITKTDGEYTFTVPSDRYGKITVSAEFEESAYYAVAVSSSIQNGTVQANVSRAEEGDTVTLTVTPNENCVLKSGTLKYTPDGGSAADVMNTNGVYTFIMPEADVTIDAEFARCYNIFINASIEIYEINQFSSENEFVYQGVTVYTITGPTAACEGDEATFTISIDPGYTCSIYEVDFTDENVQYHFGDISSRTIDENGNVSSVTLSAMPAFDLYLCISIFKN